MNQDGTNVSRNVPLLEKRDGFRVAFKKICNLKEQYKNIIDFLASDDKKSLLLLGKENTGKTLILNKVIQDTQIYHEKIFILKDFMEKEQYLFEKMNDWVYIIDDYDNKNLHYTKRQTLNRVLSKRLMVSKMIFIARHVEKKELKNFDVIVRFKRIPFHEILDFLKRNVPESLKHHEDELLSMYHEVNGDLLYLILYLERGFNTKRANIKNVEETMNATKTIFTERDRDFVFRYLNRILSNVYIKNVDKGKKILYNDNLNDYLDYNIPVFFDHDDEGFQENCGTLSFIRNGLKYRTLPFRKALKLLAHAMVTTTKDSRVKVPITHKKVKNIYAKTRKHGKD